MGMSISPGDLLIYQKTKISARPGPNATNIFPAPNGDTYSYTVTKIYRVVEILSDQSIIVVTKRGRQRTLNSRDPALRRANRWERLVLGWQMRTSPPTE